MGIFSDVFGREYAISLFLPKCANCACFGDLGFKKMLFQLQEFGRERTNRRPPTEAALSRLSDTVCETHKRVRSKRIIINSRLNELALRAIKRPFFGGARNLHSAGQLHSGSTSGTVRALKMARLYE
jgi:hypothetical protein